MEVTITTRVCYVEDNVLRAFDKPIKASIDFDKPMKRQINDAIDNEIAEQKKIDRRWDIRSADFQMMVWEESGCWDSINPNELEKIEQEWNS